MSSRRSRGPTRAHRQGGNVSGISQLGRVIVPVSNQDAAIAFYTDKLGFTVSIDVPYGEGDRWVEVTDESGVRSKDGSTPAS